MVRPAPAKADCPACGKLRVWKYGRLHCYPCGRERARARYHRDMRDPEYRKRLAATKRAYRHGIRPQDVERLRARQEGGCAICGREIRLCVDHCHATGKIRGLLCINCNTMIGSAGDDVRILENAITYLRTHE